MPAPASSWSSSGNSGHRCCATASASCAVASGPVSDASAGSTSRADAASHAGKPRGGGAWRIASASSRSSRIARGPSRRRRAGRARPAQLGVDAGVDRGQSGRDAHAVGEQEELLEDAWTRGPAQRVGAGGEGVVGAELAPPGEQRRREPVEARVVLDGRRDDRRPRAGPPSRSPGSPRAAGRSVKRPARPWRRRRAGQHVHDPAQHALRLVERDGRRRRGQHRSLVRDASSKKATPAGPWRRRQLETERGPVLDARRLRRFVEPRQAAQQRRGRPAGSSRATRSTTATACARVWRWNGAAGAPAASGSRRRAAARRSARRAGRPGGEQRRAASRRSTRSSVAGRSR